MGDRAQVALTVLAVDRKRAEKLFNDGPSYIEDEPPELHVIFTFDEVNYGNLDFLDELEEAGIPFDSRWESGDEYGPGCRTCRFNASGEPCRTEVSDEDRNPDLNTLLAKIDNHPELKQYILDHAKMVTPLPWENQVEYSKLYRAKKLIDKQHK